MKRDQSGSTYTGKNIASGMTVWLTINSTVWDALDVAVLGDCNGDGDINITDYTLVRLYILNLKNMSEVYLEAGDTNQDANVNITDYTQIRLDILGLKKIH